MSALHRALAQIVGERGVVSGHAARTTYESDGITLLAAVPSAVVLPETTEEVSAVLSWAHANEVNVVPRGAGTGLSGGATAIEGGIVLSTARMTRVLNIDAETRTARVQTGVVNIHVSREAASYGLMFAPDPSSQTACTIGGNIAENSGGPHTLKYGVTTNHVLALRAVLPDGEIVDLGHDTGATNGYDLVGLFVGSEGTFGVATEATLRLVPRAEATRTLLGVFDRVRDASESVSAIIAAGIVPAALEMIDRLVIEAVEAAFGIGLPEDAAAVLLIELDGVEAGLDEDAEQIEALCMAHGAREVRRAKNESERSLLWKARKRAFGAMGRISSTYYTHDCVIPRSRLPEILDVIEDISARQNVKIANVFHAGDGNLHPLILFDDDNPEETERALAAGDEVLEACLAVGGALSGEHGIGAEKREWMSRVFTEADLDAMKRVRHAFNPTGRLNPNKVLPSPSPCFDWPKKPRGGG